MHLSLPLSLLNTHINLFFLLHPTTSHWPTTPPPASLAAAAVDLSSSRAPPSPHPSSSSLPSSPSPSNSPSPPSSSSPLQHHHRTAPTPGRRAGQVAPHPAPRTPQQRCDSSSVRTAACVRHHGRRRPPQAGENHPRVAPSPGRTPWLPHMAATVFSDAHDRLFVHFARNSVDARRARSPELALRRSDFVRIFWSIRPLDRRSLCSVAISFRGADFVSS
ncbi:putative formin-like protein 18 isoform X2 [Iris pallida]|uniref:Formin-like protein 18 isoform X2 n=1 Tax=Iris pallida TaxID=29817 RepID=A0AAX6FAF3_IRIPA|nr:putative formin-like protein 18 isoform X2 [Iris pallida]